ncbi:MAG: hypothetical protein ACYDHY_06485 [Acidiferrobacterales bacterium]
MLKQNLRNKLKDVKIFQSEPCLVCGKDIQLRNQPQGYIHQQYLQNCEKDAQKNINAPEDPPTAPPTP